MDEPPVSTFLSPDIFDSPPSVSYFLPFIQSLIHSSTHTLSHISISSSLWSIPFTYSLGILVTTTFPIPTLIQQPAAHSIQTPLHRLPLPLNHKLKLETHEFTNILKISHDGPDLRFDIGLSRHEGGEKDLLCVAALFPVSKRILSVTLILLKISYLLVLCSAT